MRGYLKDLRDKLGATQEQVALKLNCSQQNYHLIESGNRQKEMGLKWILKLASCFDVPFEYIVQEEQKWYEAS